MDWSVVVPIWIVCGIVTAAVGVSKADPDQKTARGILYFCIGVALGPLGLLLAFADNGERVVCPHCRSQISGKASVCPKCTMAVQ